MAYVYTWDTADPVGSDFVSDGARVIREDVKGALNERLLTIFSNMTDQPLKFLSLQFAADDTYSIGTAAIKPTIVWSHAVSVGTTTEAGEGNILVGNAKAIQSRNAADNASLDLVSMSAANILQLYGGLATLTATGVFTTTTVDAALTGNASTATALATARAINGVDFDGTAAITVTADAGTLTGTTLAANVVDSILTSVGTIDTGVWNGTPVDEAYGGTGQSAYAQGDLLVASAANTLSRLPIGAAGTFLKSDGTDAAWSATTKPDSNRCLVTMSASQSVVNTSLATLAFDQETYDVGGFHDNVTDNSRLTIPSGGGNNQYIIRATVSFEFNATADRLVTIVKNGATRIASASQPATTSSFGGAEACMITLTAIEDNPADGDYYEVIIRQNSGGALNVSGEFQIVHI